MSDIFKKYKTPIIILVFLIVAFVVYSFFFTGKGDTSNVLLTSNAPTTASAQIGQSFVNQLLTLQNVKLDNKLFADPRFQSLQDFSQPIADEPQGRPNPFAPIGFDVSNGPTISSASSTGTTNFTIQSSATSSTSKTR